MLGIARIAEKGLVAAAALAAAIAFLGVMSFDMNVFFGVLATPVTSMFSGAVLAFVLLRHQEQAAVTTAFVAGALVVAASLLLQQDAKPALVFTAMCWVATLIVAGVLRNTISLKAAVLATVPMVVLIGVVASWYKPDIVHFWQFSLQENLAGLSAAELEQLGVDKLEVMRTTMPELLVASAGSWAFFIVLCGVFLARRWQAQLFNVGGFQKEFHSLRLGREAVWFFIVLFVLAQFIAVPFVSSMASVMMLVFFIQGLSVLHCLTKQRGLSKSWLTGIYVVLMIPPTMLVLSVLGMADNIFRLRKI